jgi:hypothetical protein
MSYGYTIYNEYSPFENAQPPPELDIHPNSAAAQLRLAAKDLVEILADQEIWSREEY